VTIEDQPPAVRLTTSEGEESFPGLEPVNPNSTNDDYDAVVVEGTGATMAAPTPQNPNPSGPGATTSTLTASVSAGSQSGSGSGEVETQWLNMETGSINGSEDYSKLEVEYEMGIEADVSGGNVQLVTPWEVAYRTHMQSSISND